MAKYKIECEQFLGYGCGGYDSVTASGESTIELSDEEEATLVKLIQEKNTTDVNELGIAASHPGLYAKLDKAYHDMACHTEYMYWIWKSFEEDDYEYVDKELIDYCERECGFSFEDDESDFLDDNGDLDEKGISYAKSEAFRDWLHSYVRSLSDDDLINFMCKHMDFAVNDDYVEYTVNIPEDIIRKAKEHA